MTAPSEAILSYWFGQLDPQGLCHEQHRRLWFTRSDATDTYCREQFGELITQAIAGALDHWAETDRGRVALILLLDQFTRNAYRGTAAAFSGDSQALALAQSAISRGDHLRLPTIHRVFLYFPLEHREDRSVQQQCVALYEELAASTGNHEQLTSFHRYAIAHQEIIDQFGRFPHRNAILGRNSTPEELAHLASHGGF